MFVDEGIWIDSDLLDWHDLPVPDPNEVDLDLDWELTFDCLPD